MRLNEYVKKFGINLSAFAKNLGMSRSSIDTYLKGTMPRLDVALKIEELTDGQVSAILDDWVEPKRKKSKPSKNKKKD